MNISLTKTQYWALMNIYGPPKNVHDMIMNADSVDGKYLMEGEEIGEGLCSNKDATTLLGVCKKVDPSSLNWIGA